MMKRYFAILALSALLIPLIFGGVFQASTALAQDGENNTKISGLLKLQVEAKLRAVETGGVAEVLEEGRVDILQAMGTEVEDLNRQRIFIHLAQPPNQSQIEELESIGLTLYLDSWIPPVGAHPTGFIIADMPIDKLEELAENDYVVRLDTAERVLEPQNDLATQKINADDVWNTLGYDGTGVTIAVLDSGLDVTHNDIPTPVASKDYSAWPTLDDTIANTVTGHGTHVTGSALGRGTQSGGVYKGSAPGADLIFLKIGRDSDSRAPTDAMVNAIRDAVDVYNADIITMSYGSWSTYHDGTSQTSQAVDYAVSQGAVVFISAGNKADKNEHYSGTVAASSSTGFIQVNVTGAGPDDTLLWFNLVWFDGLGTHNELELHYYDSSYNELTNINAGAQSESSRGTEAVDYLVLLSGSTYYLKAENKSASSQLFHIYVIPFIGSATFQNPDPFYTITSPADADSAIAVGSYNTRQYWWDYANVAMWYPSDPVDQISIFSSWGPRVDTGAPPKPNIVAPGLGIISARDNDAYPWASGANTSFIDNDGPNENNATKNDGNGPADYYVMDGTSMASPMAAGAAALLMEAQPELKGNPAAVRDRLQQTASKAGSPDYIWGYGLIDIHQAVASVPAPPSVTTNNATSITSTSATLNGNLSSKGTASTVYVSFEHGLTTAYGNETTPQAMTTTGPFSFNLGGLSPNTTYHFRAKAAGDSTIYGSDESFTTLPPVVPPATSATRTLPASVRPGANFDVGIVASGSGQIGQVAETLPTGFSYVGTTSDDVFVTQVGNLVRFSFMGDGVSFDYTVTASTIEGTYTFSGVVKDADLNEYTIGGDSTITVSFFNPWDYDLDEDGVISKMEALTAVVDYFGGLITKQQALEVIVLYFAA